MLEISSGMAFSYLVFIAIPLVFIAIFRKFNLPEISAAVLGGIVVSLVLPDAALTLRELGIVLIYIFFFCAGLNVQLEQRIKNTVNVYRGLLVQLIALTGITLILLVFGFSFTAALFAGVALIFASIGIITTILYAKGEEISSLGETVKTFLSWQQVTLAIVLIFLTHSDSLFHVTVSFGVVVAMYLVLFRNQWIPFEFVQKQLWLFSPGTRDVFLFLLITVIVWVMVLLGFPLLVSLYVAGILTAELTRKASLLPYVKKIKRLLTILLCIFIGTQLNLGLTLQHPFYLTSLSLVLFFAKWLLTLAALVVLGYSSRVTFALATYFAGVGEITFVLLFMNSRLLRPEEYTSLIPVIIVSIFLQPILKESQHTIYYYLRHFIRRYVKFLDLFLRRRLDSLRLPTEHISLKNHIVVCGYGRVGSQICRALAIANIPFVIVDQNYSVVLRAREDGLSSVYGEPTDHEVLAFAKVADAAAVVITVSGRFNQEKILLESKKLNPKIIIMTCVYTIEDQQRLRDLGADVVVQPKSEAALTLVKDLYYLKRLPRESMRDFISYFKLELGID